jgi:hypothetical protein
MLALQPCWPTTADVPTPTWRRRSDCRYRRCTNGFGLEQRGVIRGYAARIDGEQIGLPLTAFVSLTPIDPAEPDDYPQRLLALRQIEACYSVAGVESYIVKVRVASPGALETLLAQIRATANVSTRTTVVLSTPFEDRPVTGVPVVPTTGGADSADTPVSVD